MRRFVWMLPLAAFALASCTGEAPQGANPAGDFGQACIAPGGAIPAFTVNAVTGPKKGTALCYV
jgi:hypothetical protein